VGFDLMQVVALGEWVVLSDVMIALNTNATLLENEFVNGF